MYLSIRPRSGKRMGNLMRHSQHNERKNRRTKCKRKTFIREIIEMAWRVHVETLAFKIERNKSLCSLRQYL